MGERSGFTWQADVGRFIGSVFIIAIVIIAIPGMMLDDWRFSRRKRF